MRHCFFCAGDFPDETRMVMARGGSEICQSCAKTERGQRETAARSGTEGYYPGTHQGGIRFRKGFTKWKRRQEIEGR